MWENTGFDYDLWKGKRAPSCPHCKKPLIKVVIKETKVLVWNIENTIDTLTTYEEDTQDALVKQEYLCPECHKALPENVGIGINGVDVYYRKSVS